MLSRSKLYVAIFVRLATKLCSHSASYAIPVITRFVADLLGFWDNVKTEQHKDRLYNENQIYQHIDNCQSYKVYESDETALWKRRVAFQKSIEFLKKQAEHGAEQARVGYFGRFTARGLKTAGDDDYVVRVREFGVKASRELAAKMGGPNEAAAVMLAIVLDAAHKSVMTVS